MGIIKAINDVIIAINDIISTLITILVISFYTVTKTNDQYQLPF